MLYGAEGRSDREIIADYRARVQDAISKDWRETPCWEWPRSKDGKGYGQCWFNGRLEKAHRIAYKLAHPEWNWKLCVCHHCDNPGCINPGHFFLGTNADNVADKMAKGRQGRTIGETNGRAKLTEQQVQEIRDMAGTQQSIADRYGIHQTAVGFIKRGEHWKHVLGSTVASSGRSKLSERQVREIRAAHGLLREIAVVYGISLQQVSLIKNKKEWKHVK